MGELLNSYIMPHPPIIVPGIGGGRENEAIATIEACRKIAGEIVRDAPSTILISSPHAPCFRDVVILSNAKKMIGDFGRFGHPEISMEFDNNIGMVEEIVRNAREEGIQTGFPSEYGKRRYGLSDELDHGAMVPLYFVSREMALAHKHCRLVHISTPFLPLQDLYRFGKCIQKTIRDSAERVVYLASGDLSHRLTTDAPAGYNPYGKIYDTALVEKIRKGDTEGILSIKESQMEEAGECGTRSFVMMLGALDGHALKSTIYSYEGPFGVGYLAAKIETTVRGNDIENIRESESDYTALARETVETYVRERRQIDIPEWLPHKLANFSAGTFVSIKKGGELRGCIGTIQATQRNVAEEIIHNAIHAATRDPRFEPIDESELPDLVYSVDILKEPHKIDSLDQLNVKKYGVIVSRDYRRGLLLPDLEGVDTPADQVAIALRKAGISQNESYEMQRFEVVRYH